MLAHRAITQAEDDVIGALQREGGELSYPELVNSTNLPYAVLNEILEHLKSRNRVEIDTWDEEGAGVRLVRLRTKPFVFF